MTTPEPSAPEPSEREGDTGRMSSEQWVARLREIRQEMVDENRALPQGYLAALPFAIRAARERGYALAHHGTFGRDLDLIAVPWTDDACGAEELAVAVAAATGTNIIAPDKDPATKPHGRQAWSLHFHSVSREGWAIPQGAYIDLSVMPRAALKPSPSPVVVERTDRESVMWRLHRFLDCAGGEGLELGGVDAGDLFMEIFEQGALEAKPEEGKS